MVVMDYLISGLPQQKKKYFDTKENNIYVEMTWINQVKQVFADIEENN